MEGAGFGASVPEALRDLADVRRLSLRSDAATLTSDRAGLYVAVKEGLLSVPEPAERMPGFVIWELDTWIGNPCREACRQCY